MDYQHIAALTSPETARKIDEEYDSLIYKDIDAEQLDGLIKGAVILGSETIDYPLTDGMIVYLKLPAGDVISVAFDIDADPTGLVPLLVARVATIQEGST